MANSTTEGAPQQATAGETSGVADVAGEATAADEGNEQVTSTESTAQQRRDERTRARLRETERERDTLRAALLPHVRAAVEKTAGESLVSGSAIWLLPDLDPMTLLTETYDVDAEKVSEAVERLLQHAPQFGQRATSFDAGARQSPTVDGPSWHRLMEH